MAASLLTRSVGRLSAQPATAVCAPRAARPVGSLVGLRRKTRSWAASGEPLLPSTVESENGAGAVSSSDAGDKDGKAAVEAALAAANGALKGAENNLENLHKLPSAYPENPLVTKLKSSMKYVFIAACLGAFYFTYGTSRTAQFTGSVLVALVISLGGYAKMSLSFSGAVAAFMVGISTLGSSFRCGALLLAFFYSSSALTKFKEGSKSNIDDGFKAGGQRDWKQVACNGFVPSVLALVIGLATGQIDMPLGVAGTGSFGPWLTALQGAFIGYFACCCADTWASELGVLSEDQPRLITNLRPVRRGTNGGVTMLGLGASVGGGIFIGLVAYAAGVLSPTMLGGAAAANVQWQVIALGAIAGTFGSLLDSLLGATVQFTGFDISRQLIVSKPGEDVQKISGFSLLTNNAVNLVSATTTALLSALLAVQMF